MKSYKKLNVFTAALLAVATLQSAGISSTLADAAVLDTITVSSGTIVPSTLTEGGYVIVRGMLKSTDSVITGVNIGVFTEEGCRVTGKTVYPNTMTYNLNQVDEYVRFNELEPGTYYYKVYASNSTVSGSPIVHQEFTVKSRSGAAPDTPSSGKSVTISGSTGIPDTITEGKAISIWGTIKSDSKLHAVTVGIYDTKGNPVYAQRVYPGTKTFDVHTLDNEILFSKLKPGAYSYQIIAANADGNNHVLTNQAFTVKAKSDAGDTSASSISISGGTKVPTTLTQGNSVIVRGVVKSDSKITALRVGIYDTNENPVYVQRAYPDAKTFDVHTLDDKILFNNLKPGTYSYQIIAANADGNNHVLTNQAFTVKAKSDTEENNNNNNTSSTVTISGGTKVPATLMQGNGVVIRGVVKSNSKISSLNVGIYDENSRRVSGKTIFINAYSYDLNRLDASVLFSKLEPGNYSYQVIAANKDSDNNVVTNQNFTVKSSSNSSDDENNNSNEKSVALTGGTKVPSVLTKGKGVIVEGTVKSIGSKLEAVTVSIYTSAGKCVDTVSDYPNAYSYNLNLLDANIAFSQLKPGEYFYTVIAANDDSKNHVLTHQAFAVVDELTSRPSVGTIDEDENKTSSNKLELSGGTSVPSRISVGDGVIIKGKVTSPSKMTALTVAVFNEDNQRVTGKTVYPSAYTYDLNQLDANVNFHKLDAGKYTYMVIVANDDGNNMVLSNQKFCIVD